jgi:hypothetical protein
MKGRTGPITETGEIASQGKNPVVEVEVPDNQIADVSAYSFGLWFRF